MRGQITVMNVKFTNTTSTKLSSLAITNGQLIALSDKPQISYDLGGVRKSLTVSDNYTSSAGTAASGVAASSYALNQVYNNTLKMAWSVQNVGQMSNYCKDFTYTLPAGTGTLKYAIPFINTNGSTLFVNNFNIDGNSITVRVWNGTNGGGNYPYAYVFIVAFYV